MLKFNFDSSFELKPASWVDVWYDRRQKMWTATLKNDDDFQIGEIEYGTKRDIEITVEEWIREHCLDRNHVDQRQKEKKNERNTK